MRALAAQLALCLLLAACSSAPPPPARPVPPPAAAVVPAPQPETAPRPAVKEAQAAPAAAPRQLYRSLEAALKAPTAEELRVLASAKDLVGMKPDAKVAVNGKQFQLDCIGTVSAIFYKVDIDVTRDFDKYSGNGVNRLYMTLKSRGVLHFDRYPRPGDVIIWDNTWDANGNGDRSDDPKTHAGVVMSVDDDGTISYVHENLFKGVVIEEMNLLRPKVASDESGKRLNSGLAIASVSGGPKPEHWLSGDVFNAFGDVLRIKGELKVARAEGEGTELEGDEPLVLALLE
jgi:hypothetical protein